MKIKNLDTMGIFFIAIVVIIILVFPISSLIFWGIGNLVIKVFGISYIWTFWHGVCCAIIFALLQQIFGNKRGN